ncbi:pollen-specific leucine-rich repeat extensin-like protein 1 [Asbolus verrucosus]|uniref:Pollen-specific leucine-rich repeat extensin-like protein 1 n=1 Tax=Asbolus verrucosus TaxID=1661398 RepID=A0A482VD01_ASBVE|nr:pollen-specific leucine-rich repeat extensin-like protein 1 [Asbolus verrucosus]
MLYNCVIIFACALIVHCKNLPENNTAIISTYAKVAHWGSVSSTTEKSQSEARSHNGQTLWTHRSDVNIIGGQKLKTVKPAVVYHYAVQKAGQGKTEIFPAVGEVQERFNPRPYFDYTHVPSKYANSKSETKTKPAPSPAPTFDSFPVFSPTADSSNPPTDLYTSQYTSYNPPNAGLVAPPEDKPDIAYPPNAPPPPGDTDDSPPKDINEGYSYNAPPESPPAPEGPPTYPTLGPPLAPYHHGGMDHHNHNEQVYYPPSDDGNHHETILDHPPPGWEEPKPDMAAPSDMVDINGHGMNGMNDMNGHDMAEHDLSPPPSPDFNGQFPQYLYNGPHGQAHDFDSYDFDQHHVYKEVTTTEAPEDERVNKGHYSYYYLGRKLWYIPLYFSVYFIIYVTVLILKSIARHKIQFKHEHFHRDAHGRELNFDEKIDDIHANVTSAINTSRKKFLYVAM